MSFFEARPGEDEDVRKARVEARHLAHLVETGAFAATTPAPGESRQVDGYGKDLAGFRRKIEAADIEAPNASEVGYILKIESFYTSGFPIPFLCTIRDRVIII